jgi:hypothetical protein
VARTNDHSFTGWMRNISERVTLLERRWMRAGGGSISRYGVFNEGVIPSTKMPNEFPFGVTIGYVSGDSGYPSTLATIEVVNASGARTLQRVTEKGETSVRTWQRAASGDGSAWGPFVLQGGGWVFHPVSASGGFTMGSSHPSGTSITGTPHVYTREGLCTVRASFRAPATSVGGILTIASGFPTPLYTDHSLSGVGILASSPGGIESEGSLFADRGVYITGTALNVRCQTAAAFAPNEYFEVSGVYPIP